MGELQPAKKKKDKKSDSNDHTKSKPIKKVCKTKPLEKKADESDAENVDFGNRRKSARLSVKVNI